MSPVQIKILLHYYSSPEDYPTVGINADFLAETIGNFVNESMLERVTDGIFGGAEHRLAPRGHAYVGGLLALPLPHLQTVWAFPPTVIEDMKIEEIEAPTND